MLMYTQTGDQDILKWIMNQLGCEEKYGRYIYDNTGHLVRLSLPSPPGEEPTRLPAEIGLLTHLQEFNMYATRLTYLPPEIGRLKNLQSLNLADNQLASLPPEIGQLPHLETLTLSNNQLTHLPVEIEHLKCLQTLDLTGNQLHNVPLALCACSSLRFLYVDRNDLLELPTEIGQLTNVCSLWVNDNHLTHLPPEIRDLVHLRSLSVGHNHLTTLPPEVGQLTSLLDLYCYGNQLASLPVEIKRLSQLAYLNLGRNPLVEFPAALTSFSNLLHVPLDKEQQQRFADETLQLTERTAQHQETESSGARHPRLVCDDEVFVLYSQFELKDLAESDAFQPDFQSGHEQWIQSGSATIVVISQTSDHVAQIRLEIWDKEPPYASGFWEERREVPFQSKTGEIALWSMAHDEPSEQSPLLIGPAGLKYTVRASRHCHPEIARAIGRYEREEERSDDEEDELFPRYMEHYLLQFWPA